MDLESWSSRPIRVLLPSSTEPAVANLRMSLLMICLVPMCKGCGLPDRGDPRPWRGFESGDQDVGLGAYPEVGLAGAGLQGSLLGRDVGTGQATVVRSG